jgi:hypothetical protein
MTKRTPSKLSKAPGISEALVKEGHHIIHPQKWQLGFRRGTNINKEADLGKRTTSFANQRHRGVPVARKRMDLFTCASVT